jgi:hypothetical protein
VADLKFNINQLTVMPTPVEILAEEDLISLEAEWHFDKDTFIIVSNNSSLVIPGIIPINPRRFPILAEGVTVYLLMNNGFTLTSDIFTNGARSYSSLQNTKLSMYRYFLVIRKFKTETVLTMPYNEVFSMEKSVS